MDVLYFLKERTDFVRRHYNVCVGAFETIKRQIENQEAPYDDPPYSEDPEPPYLEEWIEADTSIQMVGITCVSLLSGALKLYLNLLQQEQLRFAFREDERKRLKKDFVGTYRDALGEILGTDWSETNVDFEIIEQVVLARNRGQHGIELTSFLLTHDAHTLARHPRPFFVSTREREAVGDKSLLDPFLDPMLTITRESLFIAAGEIEKLAEWVDTNMDRAISWQDSQMLSPGERTD